MAMNPTQQPVDPYWIWGSITNFVDFFPGRDEHSPIAVLAELKKGNDPQLLQAKLKTVLAPEDFEIPSIDKKIQDAKFMVLYVSKSVVTKKWNTLSNYFERLKLGWAINTPKIEKATTSKKIELKDDIVMAIIDDQIAYDHPTFIDEKNKSRFRFFLEQDPSLESYDGARRYWRYGWERAYLHKERKLVQSLSVPSNVRHAQTHGTHVASLLAGKETPGWRLRHDVRAPAYQQEMDEVSKLNIIGVSLPSSTVADTSCASLAPHALSALHYIVSRCSIQTKMIVNMSFGRLAGPHDGSSLLERAIDDLINVCKDRLVLVMPAGNGFRLQHHASWRSLTTSRNLVWRVPPDNPVPIFMELWTNRGANIEIEIQLPDGQKIITSSFGKLASASDPFSSVPTCAICAAIPCPCAVDSPEKQLILIAIAPTGPSAENIRPRAPAGDWVISVKGDATDEVNAWIERDDVPVGKIKSGRRSYFVDSEKLREDVDMGHPSSKNGTRITGYGSINGVAPASALMVGGYVWRDESISYYSGAGELGMRHPDGTAPSEQSRLIRGIPGAAASSVGVARYWGTSVAAPIAARSLAIALCRGQSRDLMRHVIITVEPSKGGYWRLGV